MHSINLQKAVMAGAKMMKIAYVTRNNAKNNREHSIVQVSQFKPKDFALQMQLMLENSWAVLRCLIDECMRLPSGKYLLLKVKSWPFIIELFNIIFSRIQTVLNCCCTQFQKILSVLPKTKVVQKRKKNPKLKLNNNHPFCVPKCDSVILSQLIYNRVHQLIIYSVESVIIILGKLKIISNVKVQ